MTKLHFKQAGVFHLQKLQILIREKTGLRYKLSDTDSLVSLIQEIVNHYDESLDQEFQLFYQNCWPCTQEYITTEFLPKNLEDRINHVLEL